LNSSDDFFVLGFLKHILKFHIWDDIAAGFVEGFCIIAEKRGGI
jgi:hypothetical protein